MTFASQFSATGAIGVVALLHSFAVAPTAVPALAAHRGPETFVTYATSTGQVCVEANAITEIRRISGLTFKQLSKVLAVTRRTLHLWVSGQRMQPSTQERVQRTLAAIRQIDRGAPDLTLAALLGNGARALDLLERGELSSLVGLLGVGAPQRLRPAWASAECMAERTPPSPANLVQASQDGPHPATHSGQRITSMKAAKIPRGK